MWWWWCCWWWQQGSSHIITKSSSDCKCPGTVVLREIRSSHAHNPRWQQLQPCLKILALQRNERDLGHWASSDPSMPLIISFYSVCRHFQGDWRKSGMILCTWSTLLSPLYSCCFEFIMVKDDADEVSTELQKLRHQTTDRWKTMYTAAFLLQTDEEQSLLLVLLMIFFSQSYCR